MALLPVVVTVPYRINMVRHKYITTRISVKDGCLWEVGLADACGRLRGGCEVRRRDRQELRGLDSVQKHIFLSFKHKEILVAIQCWVVLKSDFQRMPTVCGIYKKIRVVKSHGLDDRDMLRSNIKPIKPLTSCSNSRYSKSKRHEADRPKLSWQLSKLASDAKFLWLYLKHQKTQYGLLMPRFPAVVDE